MPEQCTGVSITQNPTLNQSWLMGARRTVSTARITRCWLEVLATPVPCAGLEARRQVDLPGFVAARPGASEAQTVL